MGQITIDVPDEALLAFKVGADQVGAELRLAAAMKLHELGRLSSGAAARLAGIPRVLFLLRLAEFGIDSFRLNAEDLDAEARLA